MEGIDSLRKGNKRRRLEMIEQWNNIKHKTIDIAYIVNILILNVSTCDTSHHQGPVVSKAFSLNGG